MSNMERIIPAPGTPLYSASEWASAAQCAADGGDDERPFMRAREEAFERFQAWQSAGEYRGEAWREFEDFDDWLARNAPEAAINPSLNYFDPAVLEKVL